jgi:hypothetical protein
MRGIPDLPCGAQPTGPDTGLSGNPDRTVLWWHICPTEQGWVAAILSLHTVTGSIDGGATVNPSIQCQACGRHGWINNGIWVDA